MNVIIVRSYPTLVDINNNTYNRQEIGLARGFLSLGHTASIVYWGINDSIQIVHTSCGDIEVFFRKQTSIANRFSKFINIDDLVSDKDLIVCDEYTQRDSIYLAEKFQKKTIVFHGPYGDRKNFKFTVRCFLSDIFILGRYKKINYTICTKSNLAKCYLEQKGLKVEKALGVGFDASQIEEKAEEVALPNDFLVRDKNLLYVGKIEKRRNIVFLVKTLHALVADNKDYKLIIIGDGDKKYVDKVKKTIKKYQLDKRVCWYKTLRQNQLKSVYLRCKYFLLPTNYEIWGMVLMEAMYYGLVVLTTYNGGSSMLIENGVNGYIMNLDLRQWKKCVVNCDIDEKILANNRFLISDKYSWKRIASEMIDVFNNKNKI